MLPDGSESTPFVMQGRVRLPVVVSNAPPFSQEHDLHTLLESACWLENKSPSLGSFTCRSTNNGESGSLNFRVAVPRDQYWERFISLFGHISTRGRNGGRVREARLVQGVTQFGRFLYREFLA
jgi:hypothetical protein